VDGAPASTCGSTGVADEAVNAMRRARGFTLIEMLVVLAIMGILVSAAVPLAQLQQRRAKESELRASLRSLREAIDAYKQAWNEGRIEHKADDTGYPPDLQVLVDGVQDTKDPKGRRIYFLRKLPRDPFANPGIEAALTWAPRSYASPASAPQAGNDVYDISPRAPGVALDGTPYRQW
jgi:general secretion pathway protein G